MSATFSATIKPAPMTRVTVLVVATTAKTMKGNMTDKIIEKVIVILRHVIGDMAGVTVIKMRSVHLTFS